MTGHFGSRALRVVAIAVVPAVLLGLAALEYSILQAQQRVLVLVSNLTIGTSEERARQMITEFGWNCCTRYTQSEAPGGWTTPKLAPGAEARIIAYLPQAHLDWSIISTTEYHLDVHLSSSQAVVYVGLFVSLLP